MYYCLMPALQIAPSTCTISAFILHLRSFYLFFFFLDEHCLDVNHGPVFMIPARETTSMSIARLEELGLIRSVSFLDLQI